MCVIHPSIHPPAQVSDEHDSTQKPFHPTNPPKHAVRLRPGAPPFASAICVGDPALACFQLDDGVFRLISAAPPAPAAAAEGTDDQTAASHGAATANGGGGGGGGGMEDATANGAAPPGISYKAGVGPAALNKEAVAFLLALLQERCPEVDGLFDVEWSARFRVHRRLADRYRVGNAFLMGDAAHIHSPVGGQGLNTGLQDAVNLAWKLALVERFGAGPAALLGSYGEERRPCGAATLSATDSLTNTVFFGGLLQRAARFVLFPLVPLVVSREFVARRLVRWMSQMTVNVRASSLVRGEVSETKRTKKRGGGGRQHHNPQSIYPREEISLQIQFHTNTTHTNRPMHNAQHNRAPSPPPRPSRGTACPTGPSSAWPRGGRRACWR